MAKIERLFLKSGNAGNANIYRRQAIDEAAWIWRPGLKGEDKAFLIFRRKFVAGAEPLTIHVSADERYELMLDGKRISRGPHRGNLWHWPFQSYRIELEPGEHEISALVWKLNEAAPLAQISWRGGFILKAEGAFYSKQLSTGEATWSVALAGGWKCLPPSAPGAFGVGASFEWADGCEAIEAEMEPVEVRGAVHDTPYGNPAYGWMLEPSPLPDMLDRELCAGFAVAAGCGIPDDASRISKEALSSPRKAAWTALVRGAAPIEIPPRSEEFAIIDLDDYYTAYPLLELSGGKDSSVSLSWAEALCEGVNFLGVEKEGRNSIEGRHFIGMKDVFRSDGKSRAMSVPWWRAGRYWLVSVKTAEEPLLIKGLRICETGYPLGVQAAFSSPDAEDLDAISKICVRALRACSHETFMDCPYYEQLMYVGDTRLEMLTTYALSEDARLARRCIDLFDYSRVNWGFVNERYPTSQIQHSPTFSMIWTLMLHDHVLWRGGDKAWQAERMASLRAMMERFTPYLNADSLLESLPGWPFMDWATPWEIGVPPDGRSGVSGPINLLYALSLQKAAELEDLAGEELLARRCREKANAAINAVRRIFWSEQRGLFADDIGKTLFSEHSQSLAILCGAVKGERAEAMLERMLKEEKLVRASSYFIFYLFEAFRMLGRADLIQPRLEMWREMLRLGFKTTPEEPRIGTRSDCHAWSAQILFHFYASIAGIRPASQGFQTVRIEPQLGAWKSIAAKMPHPSGGMIELEVSEREAQITLPPRLSGMLIWKGRSFELKPGWQSLQLGSLRLEAELSGQAIPAIALN